MKKLTIEEFIEKAKIIHGDKYDYSKVEYVNSMVKVCIICPIHGEFFVKPNDHIHKKCGCVKCSGRYLSNKEAFVEKARLIYGDKYDYSKVNYINNKTKVCIICPIHGEFWQRPNDHLSGYSCNRCVNNYKLSTEEFIEKAKLVHGNKFDYSKVEYNGAKEKVCIICPIHGEFWQIPNNHLNSSGCPICNSNIKSGMEEKVNDMLVNNGFKVERQKTFDWLKYKRQLYLDFYLPEYNIGIEVQGDQHFKPIKYFGGEEDLRVRMIRDIVKVKLCNKNDLKLIFLTKKDLKENNILNKLF